MQPDLDTLRSLRAIHDQIDFKRFRMFLADLEKDETAKAIHAVDNPDVARGRAQMISWLREQIETCKQAAQKLEIRHDNAQSRARRSQSSGGIAR